MTRDDLMSTREVAELLQRPVGTLRQWRFRGYGPESFRLGGAVVYRRSVVERFFAECEGDEPPDGNELARIAAALERIAASLERSERSS